MGGLMAFANMLHLAGTPDSGRRRAALQQAGDLVAEEAKSALGTYRYGWPALQPATVSRKSTGDSPLLETGELRGSIKAVVHSDEEAEVSSDSPKAGWHEFGTRKIPPRPFLGPAADAKRTEVEELLIRNGFDRVTTLLDGGGSFIEDMKL